MVLISAYKQLFVSEKTILAAVKDVPDEHWHTAMPAGMETSFDWVLGHYAAVEDWFLHHLNSTPYQLSDDWQKTYWSDTSAPVPASKSPGRQAITEGFTKTRHRLYKALMTDLLHWNRFAPKGCFPPKVKTRGDAWLFISAHAYWHVGTLVDLRQQFGLPYEAGKGIHH